MTSLCFQLFPHVFQPKNTAFIPLPLPIEITDNYKYYSVHYNHKCKGTCCKKQLFPCWVVSNSKFVSKSHEDCSYILLQPWYILKTSKCPFCWGVSVLCTIIFVIFLANFLCLFCPENKHSNYLLSLRRDQPD